MDNFITLFNLIGVLVRRRYKAAERNFYVLGLNNTQARLLTNLGQKNGAVIQDALSNSIFIDRSNVGRALKRLEQKGYISRCKHDDDKRANFVKITAKGRKVIVEISKLRNKMAQDFFGDLKEQEAGTIVELLRKAVPIEK